MPYPEIVNPVVHFPNVDTAMWTMDDPGTFANQDSRQESKHIATVAVSKRKPNPSFVDFFTRRPSSYTIQVVTMRFADRFNQHGEELNDRAVKSHVVFETDVCAGNAAQALTGFRDAIVQRKK